MRHTAFRILLSLVAVAAIPLTQPSAMAQPAQSLPASVPARLVGGLPVESVTIVGIKPSGETIKSFVETRAAPTRVLNKMARWSLPICPQTVGLGDKYAKYITQRIRDIAKAVGAPVNSDLNCHPNIEVVFTTAPQGFMDNVQRTHPVLLGAHHTSLEAGQMAMVTHSIQGWYATQTIDFDGSRLVDDLTCRSSGITIPYQTSPEQKNPTSAARQLTFPCANFVRASGSRINNGLSSGLFNVLIVAEPAKLLDHEIGSLADYVAMMALSQPASLDSCQVLPSISNMLASGCASVPTHITDGDLAYLRALYKMPDGTSMEIQRNEMRMEMEKTLVRDKNS
jgi:hypothetical protein